jgi:DNA-binding transcriptional ArsR family regulator/rhodanese-related sulfurtransferase
VSPTKSDLFEAVARTGRALGNGKRLELLDLLAQTERPVQELAEVAGLNLTTASAHLQVLRDAGLVDSRRDGTRVYYRLADPAVAALVTALCRMAEQQRPEVQATLEGYLPTDDVRLMSRRALLEAAAAGTVVVVDVRPAHEFAAGHLEGARSIPLDELADRLAELPPDVDIVAYCRGRYCVLSHQAVRLLEANGRQAALSEEGMLEWLGTDMPLTDAHPAGGR